MTNNDEEVQAFHFITQDIFTQDSQKTMPKDIKGMWNAYSYYVGGQLFTLDEIEHGILRLLKMLQEFETCPKR